MGNETELVGQNVLGQLLTELRNKIASSDARIQFVEPLDIPDFRIYGDQIQIVEPVLIVA